MESVGPDMEGGQRNATLLRLAANASVATAGLLVVVKFGAWWITGSVSVLASLVDSLMDAAASLINFAAVRYSLKSADSEHQFGHGKAESLAALAQAAFITGSAIFLVIHAAERLNNPLPVKQAGAGVGVMVFAILSTLVLLAIQYYVIRRTGSQTIRADSLHYRADLLTNSGTMVALFLAQGGLSFADPVLALIIAAYIFHSTWQIGSEAAQLLMDRELSAACRARIFAIATSHDRVIGVHDLRTRQSGQTKIVQLHLDLDERLPLSAAHGIAKTVEREIQAVFPEADVIIHQDPVVPRQAAPVVREKGFPRVASVPGMKKVGRGLLIVNTGDGKGKTTSAFGQALRAAGHGGKVCIVQFIKGRWRTGEAAALRRLADDVELHVVGSGFTWLEKDRGKIEKEARAGWELARHKLLGGGYGLLILDELTYLINYGLVPAAEVQAALAARPPGVTVVVTGRDAPGWLIDCADIATEMLAAKHDYDKGREAMPGIEY